MQAEIRNGLDQPADLLERSGQLALLAEHLDAVTQTGSGRLVLVAGEAGVGKTALLRRFCGKHIDSTSVLWGACDALFTPRPLGPFFDVAAATGGELEELVESGGRPHEIAAALTKELGARAPAILIVEDAGWADEASLDVLRLVGRRIDRIHALAVVSYRDDELDRDHPLRVVIGELATSEGVHRLRVEPLSAAGVAALAEPTGVDPNDLYRKTGGNPFFVTEALAAGEETIPSTVRDAVLARAARLTPAAWKLLEAVAVVPPQAEVWLLEEVAGEMLDRLEECLGSGMLTANAGRIAFRHELARLTVEDSLPANRAHDLHRRVLAALLRPPDGAPDLARLAHHADSAGDAKAVLRFAPAAGERAQSLGANREAAAQYARALRFAKGLPPDVLGDLLERRAYTCYITGYVDEAFTAQERALECFRELGDPLREGDGLRSLSRLLRYVGRSEEAMAVGRQAVAVLEDLPPGRELGMAYCNLSHLYVHLEDPEGTIEWGTRALELGQGLDDPEPNAYALTNIGVIELLAGNGTKELERALEVSRRAKLEEHAGRAFLNLTWWANRGRVYTISDRFLEPGLEYCTERGLDMWRSFLLASRARAELDRGRWEDAVASAGLVLRDPRSSPVPRITALAVLGLVRARRGDPEVWPPLDEAWELAKNTEELQRMEPPAATRAEAAWLEGRPEAVVDATGEVFDLAVRRRAWWIVGELAFWRRSAGVDEYVPAATVDPWAAQLRGDWRRAAKVWDELESPYEAALVLAEAEDERTLRRALDQLQRMGAQPAAAIVSRRLRERGARGLPRGPRPATRKNPAGLTPRELEVLALVAKGLRNAEIAGQLVVAQKTVDHHISAILRKLDVRTRGEAAAAARRMGLVEDR